MSIPGGISFEKRLSFGNVLTIAMLAIAIMAAWNRRESDVENIGREMSDHKSRIIVAENRIASLENTSSSNQESLRWIKETLSRIERAVKP